MDWSALTSAGIMSPLAAAHHILQNIVQNYSLSFVSIAVDLYKSKTSQNSLGTNLHTWQHIWYHHDYHYCVCYLQETIDDPFPQFTVYQITVMEH